MENNDYKTEKFIELYNIFDDLLRDKYKEFSRSFSMIQKYIDQLENTSSDENIKKARQINMIRVLRNNLVHEFDMNKSNLIIISDETIDFLESEIEYLKNPTTAYDICTKFENLYCVKEDDHVKDIITIMIKKGFTQVPVLTLDKRIVGVFSPNCIFQYMAKYEDKKILDKDQLKIKDFIEFIPINKHISEAYVVVERECPLDDVRQIFDKSYKKGKKTAAILVTEHGDISQRLLGIIVPYDIIKIDNI